VTIREFNGNLTIRLLGMELDVPMELGGGMYWGIGTASDPLLVPVERSEGLVVSATTDLTL
jgi:hypothetical protein